MREPETARFARNSLHEKWLQFRLGWPAHRVTTMHVTPSSDSQHTTATEWASQFERVLP